MFLRTRTRTLLTAVPCPHPPSRRSLTTTVPLLQSSRPSSKSKRHHPHNSPARTSPPHSHSTPRAAPVSPGTPRSAPLPGSNTAAAGPTGFVSSGAIASPLAAGSWWSSQSRSTRASLAALGVSGYLITAWVVYQALADKEDAGKAKAQDAEKKNKVGADAASPALTTGNTVTQTPAVAPTATACQADHKHVYDQLAPSYDWSIGWDELVMGLLLVRRWVISHAKGETLELAAGTGRNTAYYGAPPKVTSLTLTDTSIPMLDQAVRTHLTKTSPDGQPLTLATTKRAIPARVLPADAHALPLADKSFDTVISTFSLCSLHDPVRAVREGIRVLKPGGSMWLVEHGRGAYDWLNRSLDKNAVHHAEKWGCWYNRDIGQLVGEAVAQVSGSGKENVKINRQYRLHFGTTWIIEVVKEA